MKHIAIIISLLISTIAMAQSESMPTDTFNVAFRVNQQTRRYKISLEEKQGDLIVNWTMMRNLHLQKGQMVMNSAARKNATHLSYQQPTDLQSIQLESDELWLFISQEAFNQLKTKKACHFNNGTPYKVINESSEVITIADVDSTDGHCEMQILNNPDFPLILNMSKNPVGIDWKTTR